LPGGGVAGAGAILRALETQPAAGGRGGPAQLGLWGAPPAPATPSPDLPQGEILDALRAVDPDDLSPRAAHQLVVELKRKLTPSP
jgi:hypothetical protein